ncbi:MAG TPA: hypothetical protein VGP93_15520 [Polyangiaceae bacterium]|nr:hypothetical protein [Polyangiaceae bacterium]
MAVLVLAASTGLLGWLLFGESDEERIRSNLRSLAAAVATREDESIPFRTARLNGVFKELLHPDVTLEAPELAQIRGRRDLALLAASAPRAYGAFTISLEETEVEISAGSNRARATARVSLIGKQDGELRRDRRNVRFQLQKQGSTWLVGEIYVAAKTDEQPEARP